MAGETATGSIIKALATYLKANVAGLQEVYDDFPSPSQKLKYPSGSIFTGSPKFHALTPYVIWKGSALPNGKVPYKKVIGQYEFDLQLDLWVASKAQRHEIYELLVAAMNPSPTAPGLSLQLSSYHNEWARYLIRGLQYPDSEENSQRSEWRVKVDIVADIKCVASFTDYLIQTIENNVETPNEIQAGEDDSVTSIL